MPPQSWIEVKWCQKSRLEDWKRATYWAQAALLGCGRVVVGFGPDLSKVESFPREELVPEWSSAAWGALQRLLHYLEEATAYLESQFGERSWTMTIHKDKGMWQPICVQLLPKIVSYEDEALLRQLSSLPCAV